MTPRTLSPWLLVMCVGCAMGGPPSSSRETGRSGSEEGGDGSGAGFVGVDSDAEVPRCGAAFQECCRSPTPCDVGQCNDGMCEPCGNPGEACCGAGRCPGGGTCSGGVCEACGGEGEACCPGASCDVGLGCGGDICSALGGGGPGAGADSGTDGGDGSPVPGAPADPPESEPAPGPDCDPGETEDRACGSCGTQSRRCQFDGTWGAFDACGGEGVCRPGDTDGAFTCSAACTWDAYTSCRVCPTNGHIAAVMCTGACPADCTSGYNAFSCARNDDTFIACGARCPAGYAPVRTACQASCLFACDSGYNAVVCSPT